MSSKLPAKLVSLFLVLSMAMTGYVITSTRGDLTGPGGALLIDSNVIIRQGDGVNYTFSEDASLTKLEVKSSSIELNDWLEIGATTSSGYLSNVLFDYRADYIRWRSDSTDSASVVTYTVKGLGANVQYDCLRDGTRYRVVIADANQQIQFTYGDGFSSHIFTIVKSSSPPSNLQASFEYTTDGNLVTFTDKSYGGAVLWVWNFGDGYGSTKQSPTHKYVSSGTYTVKLTVYDSDGKSSTAQTTIKIVLGPDNPIERGKGGWNVYVTKDLTISVSAVGLIVFGLITYATAMFFPSVPLITAKGRKVLGALMFIFGIGYFIFIDNSWWS